MTYHVESTFYLGSAQGEVDWWLKASPAVPPALRGCLKDAQKHIRMAITAVNAAAMIEQGGTPVPEEYRDL